MLLHYDAERSQKKLHMLWYHHKFECIVICKRQEPHDYIESVEAIVRYFQIPNQLSIILWLHNLKILGKSMNVFWKLQQFLPILKIKSAVDTLVVNMSWQYEHSNRFCQILFKIKPALDALLVSMSWKYGGNPQALCLLPPWPWLCSSRL